MKPIIQVGSLEISTYALILSLGACLGFYLTYREALRKKLDVSAVLTLTTVAFIVGIVGARGLAWLANYQLYSGSPWWSVFTVWDRGGMALYGGLGSAALASVLYARERGLPLWEVADVLTMGFVPVIAVARLGCFMNGCCYGKPTDGPFGIVAAGSPNNVNFGIPSHPTQLYAAFAALVLFAVLRRIRSRRLFAGQLTVFFLATYPLFVFFHELLRGDPRPAWTLAGLGPLSLNQILSVGIIAAALALGGVLERRAAGREDQSRKGAGIRPRPLAK